MADQDQSNIPPESGRYCLQFSAAQVAGLAVLLGLMIWSQLVKESDDGFPADPRGDSSYLQALMPLNLTVQSIDAAHPAWQQLKLVCPDDSGYRFFVTSPANETVSQQAKTWNEIRFVHTEQMIVGKIAFSDMNDRSSLFAWPPTFEQLLRGYHLDPAAFYQTKYQNTDYRLRLSQVDYQAIQVQWACPRSSPSWPMRLSLGQALRASAENDQQTWQFQVYELQAKCPIPSYDSGPIGDLILGLFPVQTLE